MLVFSNQMKIPKKKSHLANTIRRKANYNQSEEELTTYEIIESNSKIK